VGQFIPLGDKLVLESQDLQRLFDVLKERGYRILGPTVRDRAIVYDELGSVADLPAGWTDDQNGGSYRIRRRSDEALFAYASSPHSWKKFLLEPQTTVWQAERSGSGFQVDQGRAQLHKSALIGVRSCDLHAIEIQDRVFITADQVDPSYKSRRENLFIVAVNCGQAGGTCFCSSMKTGPKASSAFDLALTEVIETNRHYFLVEIGSALGEQAFSEVPSREARADEKDAADNVVAECARRMGRVMDTAEIKELLYRNYNNPRWDDVASRCLTCGNCTMVCPTCFCTTVEDFTDLSGKHAERRRRMDVCFTMDFSYIHGGSIRSTARARYRQWITHKLATWIDQFGVSGCVGCGRCITWCPVGIDITEETRAIRESELSHPAVIPPRRNA